MTLTNMRKNAILFFALLSMLLWSAAATLRKPSQNLSSDNALQKRLAEEDDITNLLLSDECSPFFEGLFKYISANVERMGDDEAVVELSCGNDVREEVLHKKDAMKEATPSTIGDGPLTCASAYRIKLAELTPWFHEVYSSYDTCTEEVSKELAFLHEARRALAAVGEDKRNLFWGCINWYDDEDDDYSSSEFFSIWSGWMLEFNCAYITAVNCHLEDDVFDDDIDYWTYDYWLDLFGR